MPINGVNGTYGVVFMGSYYETALSINNCRQKCEKSLSNVASCLS